MTEKEMEDLLWSHPDKLLNEPLTPFRRQPRSGVGRVDLIFTDRLSRFLVVEVKKGKLPRGAIDQLHDYFGILKKEFPDKPVELAVVANSIPEERRLACEQYNVGWYEISEKRFRDVANEVGYEFESEMQQRIISDSESHSSRDVKQAPLRATYGSSSFNVPPLNTGFDRAELKRLLQMFVDVRKREIDKSLAVKLERELLERNPPGMERGTFVQLAKWCNTENPLYWDGMDVARKISQLLFGKVLDRKSLGV